MKLYFGNIVTIVTTLLIFPWLASPLLLAVSVRQLLLSLRLLRRLLNLNRCVKCGFM